MNRAEKRRQQKLAKKNAKRLPPTGTPVNQQTLNSAIQHHSAGDLAKAEGLYQQILLSEPSHPIALHYLGVIAHQVGKHDIAVDLINKAITIKPDYAEAYYNRGNALLEQGKMDEAVASYDKAITIKPDYAEAFSNRGVALQEQGKMDEAVASFDKAITIKPDYAEAYYNRGNGLQEQGKIDEAVASYDKAITIKSDYAEAQVNKAICAWVQGNQNECVNNLSQINPKTILGISSSLVSYYTLLQILTKYYANHPREYKPLKNMHPLYAIGESHCLPPAHTTVRLNETQYHVEPKLIMGCRSTHLGNTNNNKFKAQFERISRSLASGVTAIVMFGEIDCRPDDEGILAYHNKTGGNLSNTISEIVQSYVEYVTSIFTPKSITPVFYGVPARIIRKDEGSADDEIKLSYTIGKFNQALARETKSRNITFLDVCSLTNDADGHSSGASHIDLIHLFPSALGDLTKQI